MFTFYTYTRPAWIRTVSLQFVGASLDPCKFCASEGGVQRGTWSVIENLLLNGPFLSCCDTAGCLSHEPSLMALAPTSLL